MSQNETNECRIKYGFDGESVTLTPGMTIRDAYKLAAPAFGADPGRSVTFRSAGVIIDGDSPAAPGAAYTVNVAHDPKGAARLVAEIIETLAGGPVD